MFVFIHRERERESCECGEREIPVGSEMGKEERKRRKESERWEKIGKDREVGKVGPGWLAQIAWIFPYLVILIFIFIFNFFFFFLHNNSSVGHFHL